MKTSFVFVSSLVLTLIVGCNGCDDNGMEVIKFGVGGTDDSAGPSFSRVLQTKGKDKYSLLLSVYKCA